jgi:hypothetical protein
MHVYVNKGGQQFGPYTVEQLRMYVQQGNFTTADHACFDGQNWVTIAEVPGFTVGGDPVITPQYPQAVQQQPAPTDASNPPSKKKKIILWAGIGGVATLLVAGLLIWLLGGDEAVEDMQEKEAQTEASLESGDDIINVMRIIMVRSYGNDPLNYSTEAVRTKTAVKVSDLSWKKIGAGWWGYMEGKGEQYQPRDAKAVKAVEQYMKGRAPPAWLK